MSKTILVVEDDHEIRQSLIDILEIEGYMVLKAENGRKGLELLQALTELPCLIILDLMMPVLDGLSFRQEQEKTQAFSAIPTAFFSADSQLKKKAEQVGIKDVLKKPVNLEDLFSLVRKYCG